MSKIEIGYLLRSSTAGCVVGCRIAQINAPSFGRLVRIPLESDVPYQIYGLITDIRIDDDGLVRQLVTAEHVSAEVILDNRVNRNVPVEIGVIFTGYSQAGKLSHLLPPRPPLTLDTIYDCDDQELCAFTPAGRFGYLRHVLRAQDVPLAELLAAHLQQAAAAHAAAGDPAWGMAAVKEVITLLRDDHANLMGVLGALADSGLQLS